MILLFIWLAVAASLAYEFTRLGVWRIGFEAFAFTFFVLWVLGGLLALPVMQKHRRAREAAAMLAHIRKLEADGKIPHVGSTSVPVK